MTKTLTVVAAPGLKVPREENAREYITDKAAVTVPATAYYLRRKASGELILPEAKPTKKGA